MCIFELKWAYKHFIWKLFVRIKRARFHITYTKSEDASDVWRKTSVPTNTSTWNIRCGLICLKSFVSYFNGEDCALVEYHHSKQSIYGHYGLSVRIFYKYIAFIRALQSTRKTSAIIYDFIAFDASPIIKLLLISNHMLYFYCVYFVSLPSIISSDYSSIVSAQTFCPVAGVRIREIIII